MASQGWKFAQRRGRQLRAGVEKCTHQCILIPREEASGSVISRRQKGRGSSNSANDYSGRDMSSLLRFALLVLSACTACAQPGTRFDLIVRGGDVLDGSGQPARRADVGVTGDRITAIGDLGSAQAGRVIDASGLVVAPGFIDVQGQSGTTLIADGNGESHIRQGITSEIIGEGSSPAFWTAETADVDALRPFGVTFDWAGFDGYFNKLEHRGIAIN